MKLFNCDHCGNTVYFENERCEVCGHRLGYLPQDNALLSLVQADEFHWTSPALPGRAFVFCTNARHGACNWLIPADPHGEVFCAACRHNETIPPLAQGENLLHWQTIEWAKKRLFYSLLALGVPLRTRREDPDHGLAFRFLVDEGGDNKVMTGHENGIITIALAEADDAEREKRRSQMGEPYRTLLGHFRHEIGHHYWDLLVADTPALEPFRTLFGDDRADYAASLQAHYANGAPTNWWQTHISAYATSHPWEDFAETWAHYLHIMDTVEMAAAFGLEARPPGQSERFDLEPGFDPYRPVDFAGIADHWVPLALLLNNLNRSMGHADAYPFVLTQPVVQKLGFVHDLVHGRFAA